MENTFMTRVLVIMCLCWLTPAALAAQGDENASAEREAAGNGETMALDTEAFDSGPKNTLTFAPINLVFGRLSFEYERRLGSHASFFVGPDVLLPFGALRGLEEGESLYAIEGRFGVRLFPFGNALEGFYVAFDVNAGWARAEANGLSTTGTVGGVGMAVGGQWQVDDVFALGLDIGGGVASSQVSLSDGRQVGAAGPTLKVRLSLGVAF